MKHDPSGAGEAASMCPICGKPDAHAFRPFCSKRCADVDLQRWLTERYAIPVVEDEDDPDDNDGDAAGQGGRGSL